MRARAGAVSLGVLAALAAMSTAGCGSGQQANPGAQAPATVAPAEQKADASAEIASSVDVVDARILESVPDATRAQLEMILAVVTPGTAETLTGVSTPAAAHAELLSNGRPASRISIPDSSGGHLLIGPPGPDEIALVGLRPSLKPGQSVKVMISFGTTGSGTLNVPVITPS